MRSTQALESRRTQQHFQQGKQIVRTARADGSEVFRARCGQRGATMPFPYESRSPAKTGSGHTQETELTRNALCFLAAGPSRVLQSQEE
eukprot:COSAG06_NODE_3605_length_5130_cov_14.426953_2_plen_89_part_00